LEAFDRMSKLPQFAGVLGAQMVDRPVEAIVGLSRDRQFGPVVAVGLGGIYTEVLGDIALRVAPIGEAEALRAIGSLRGASILRGARGRSLDVRALSRIVSRVSEIGVRFPGIQALDLNPVFLFECGCVAADARILVSDEQSALEKGDAIDE